MKNFDGPPINSIMKDEVGKAVKLMKKGKTAGPDKITVEMIESLDEFGIDMLTDFLNAIYDSGEIPSDLSKSIFIALPKKPGATECESHRTISLMIEPHNKDIAENSYGQDEKQNNTRNR